MKVLVTGASGLLGEDISDVFTKHHEVIALKGRNSLDIINAKAVVDYIHAQKPDVIIHCAGWRDIDSAEKEQEKALLVNALGTRNIALGAKAAGCRMVHIGTDSIFDGEKGAPYHEFDAPCPVNVYGYSKLKAEEMVVSLLKGYYIVRIPILFGAKGHEENNILYNAWKKIEKGEKLYCSTERICSPTYTKDVAEVLLHMIQTDFYGIYHVANQGAVSKYEFMKTAAEYRGFDSSNVVPCPSDSGYARRPRNTALSCLVYHATFSFAISDWRSALKRCISEM